MQDLPSGLVWFVRLGPTHIKVDSPIWRYAISLAGTSADIDLSNLCLFYLCRDPMFSRSRLKWGLLACLVILAATAILQAVDVCAMVERRALRRRDRISRLRHCDLSCARCNCINQGSLRRSFARSTRPARRGLQGSLADPSPIPSRRTATGSR
jgi:hypothetical protein